MSDEPTYKFPLDAGSAMTTRMRNPRTWFILGRLFGSFSTGCSKPESAVLPESAGIKRIHFQLIQMPDGGALPVKEFDIVDHFDQVLDARLRPTIRRRLGFKLTHYRKAASAQETIKRWGVGGLIVGAVLAFCVVLVEHISHGVLKSPEVGYPLVMGMFAVPCACVGLIAGTIVAIFRRCRKSPEVGSV